MKEVNLTEEDQSRVDYVTQHGYNDVERGPFRGWLMLAICWSVVGILGLIAYAIGKNSGYM